MTKKENKRNKIKRPHSYSEYGKSFFSKSLFKGHAAVHSKKKTFPCTECDRKFGLKGNLQKHMKIHNGVKDHKCLECGKLFTQKINLENHVVVHTKEKKFPCTKCDHIFGLQCYLDKHMKIHDGIKKHKCLECGKLFARKQHLDDHAVVHTKETPFSCEICHKRFGAHSSFSRHLRIHAPVREKAHKCLECNKSFFLESQLKNHSVVHTKEKKFLCKKCGKKFAHSNGLWYHKNKKKVPCGKMENVELQDKTPDNVAALKCWVCGDEPGFKSNLMNQFKPQNIGYRYMCPKCDLHLESADNLGDYFATFSNFLELVGDRDRPVTKIEKE